MADEVQSVFDDELDAVLEEIRRALREDAFFADVKVLVDDDQDLVSELRQALATIVEEGGKNGAAVVIEIPDLDVSSPNQRGPVYDGIVVDVNCLENVLINRGDTGTCKTARRIAKRAHKILHHRAIKGLGRVMLAEKLFKKTNPDTKDLIYCARVRTGGLVLKK